MKQRKHKALSMLGMAMRAGKLVTGDETVLKAVRQGKAALVILAADASDNTKKKFRDKCATYDTNCVEAFDRIALGEAIGKSERVILGLTDAGFAKSIVQSLAESTEVEYID
ncbi:ribosomal L7Ae/L30e/S12e/Gadd45 family protein [Paenibacillus sp. MWE-103]|uniref:Ribosomal L7Ae/L30e/S12e/Gadd45 family protein n=1 Tax=Paenibacillus artemisiicola TaxID=1172618 RepID=A0ABS3WE81_9BACL|nr:MULTISPECIES: ribosomal L7Ae/L30e/S12e/Gadd45 family protein [Paenibacillus]MBO7746612.1 ribosomal L7Ae/L30e/S12e/Gadd45 family protein [Paenibacillus artemisiicola]SFI52445.1 Ribosomal protein L7Ae [Paenibacillus sp. UNC496MF]